jgi:pimeloyl-ACP methyl ester carboxylesterase
MKNFYTLLSIIVLLFSNTIANAQVAPSAGCFSGGRYINKIFTVNTAPTTVVYGRNTAINGSVKTLRMDIYQPDNDAAGVDRPVLMFAFGGSFISGTRTDASVVQVCKAFAARGYVTCAIDYRIYDGIPIPLPDSNKFAHMVVKAVADVKAAARYLRKTAANGNPYRIDVNKILAGGISAGGIATLHAAYLREVTDAAPFIQNYINSNGGIHGNTDDPAGSAMMYSDSIHGIVNYFGGLYQTAMIDAGEPPLVSIHGTNDNVVPYNYGYANVSGINIIKINGSGRNHPRATSVGVANQLITVPGGGHGDFLTNATWTDSMDVTSIRFMYNNVVCGLVATEDLADLTPYIDVMPNPSSTGFTIGMPETNLAYTLRLTNLLGQNVSETTSLRGATQRIETAHLPNGTYLLSILFEGKREPVTKKIVVQH